jgi:hypothetical protein
MLSFLNLKAVVNGKDIYPLNNTRPVVITTGQNDINLVLTDGFHHSKPKKIYFREEVNTCCFRVTCAINDYHLLACLFAVSAMYLCGIYWNISPLKVLSFFPLLILVMIYYFNRKNFISLVPVRN